MSNLYIPKIGDIVWLNFIPQTGYEQAGRRPVVIQTYLALGEKHADMQTFQVFTGAAPGGSSTSDLHGWRKCRGLPGAVSAAIHGSRLTWKVYLATF